MAFWMPGDQTNYRELGGDYFDQLKPTRTRDLPVGRF